jgi:hypothetical protein
MMTHPTRIRATVNPDNMGSTPASRRQADASAFADWLSTRLAQIYPGARIDVELGDGDDFVEPDALGHDVECVIQDLWNDWCSEGTPGAPVSFLIVRHGANGSNQHLCDRLPVAIVDAVSGAEACDKAAERVRCFANQHLEWVAQSEANPEEWNDVLDADRRDRAEGLPGVVW